jgi:tetratricopeptide (TPR) repeat protein
MWRIAALAVYLICAALARADNFLVLPFFNLSKDPNLNWIGDSIAEAVRESLASEGLVALDRSERNEAYQRLSIRPYALLTKATVLRIGEALDAEQVIYGQYDLAPPLKTLDTSAVNPAVVTRGSLRITTYILDRKHSKQGPDFGAVGALEDLATLQRHVAWKTLQFVVPKSAPSEEEFIRRHPAVRVDAIENYIRGLLATNPEDKHRLFTQAARLESRYSQPCFELGRFYLRKNEYKLAADWLQKVSADDPHYREATFMLGLCRYNTGDFAGAQAAFQMVAAMVPLNEVYNNLGAAQSRRSLPEAVESFSKAAEGDQSDPTYHFNIGYALWKQGKFVPAAERFRAVLERKPDDAQAKLLLGRCQTQSGPRPGETRLEGLERLKTNYEESAWVQLKAALQPLNK